ncbi:hypothetical protein [Arthrobacter celericrescens]|uniref:hypothetical protein n=1 Tax=Arthrobacter celericrescens TaxID=2320851 RepID=UPI000EA028D7|nr:hypothetical protein [Arthrobacter celericrescens]
MSAMRMQDGDVLRPVDPPADEVLKVRGGVGGISFQFEELLAGANALDGVVRTLDTVVMEAETVRQELFVAELRTLTTGGPAIVTVGDGVQAASRIRDAIRATAEQVRASHREYEYTESWNAIATRVGLLHPPLLEANMLFVGAKPGTHYGDRDRVEHLVAQLPLIAGSLSLPTAFTAPVTAAVAGQTDVRAILLAIVAVPGLGYLKPRPVAARKVETTDETVDLSLAALLRRNEDLHAAGKGEIAVIKVERPDKGIAWVVLIPGTQKGEPPGGSNPIDEGGIVDALGYNSAHLTPAIQEALREAGAKPGQEVVAVGHSQGGVHAMNLAANKAFLAEYDLKYVFTAGSPVGGVTPGPGISSLHLEHTQDLVPGYDGVPNADTKDRVTVTLDNFVETPAGEDPGLGPGHRLETYAEGAERVAASRDPSLVASAAVVAGALGTAGRTTQVPAKVTRFKLTREAMPAPTPQPPVPGKPLRGRLAVRP